MSKKILLILLLISLMAHTVFGLENAKQIALYEYQLASLDAQLRDKQEQIEVLEIIIENSEQDASEPLATEPEYIGTFTVTHYCPCIQCCGKDDGITFTGTQATEGRTIAVDPDVIPLGSIVIMEGDEYVAEDVGGGIKRNRIDKYMDSHEAALQAGVVQAEVYVIGGEPNEILY